LYHLDILISHYYTLIYFIKIKFCRHNVSQQSHSLQPLQQLWPFLNRHCYWRDQVNSSLGQGGRIWWVHVDNIGLWSGPAI